MTASETVTWDRYFYFSMSLLIAAIVVFGFSQTVNDNLLHATPVRPGSSTSTEPFFPDGLLSSSCKRRWSAFAMSGFTALSDGSEWPWAARLSSSGWSPQSAWRASRSATISAFGLAIYLRRKPEFHRRLMYVATCVLTAAAFGRFPSAAFRDNWFYIGADLLILCAVVRDLAVTGRVHTVYRWAVPILILGQSLAMYLGYGTNPLWMRIVHGIVG